MVADAYKGTVTFRGRRTGAVMNPTFSADDVAGNRVTFDGTGESNFLLPADDDWDMIDIVTTEDGADTSRLELYIGAQQTPYNFLLGQVVATIPAPRILSPPFIRGGSKVLLYQRA